MLLNLRNDQTTIIVILYDIIIERLIINVINNIAVSAVRGCPAKGATRQGV